MQCPSCGGLISWEPANFPYPASHRCINCGQRFKPSQIKAMKSREKTERAWDPPGSKERKVTHMPIGIDNSTNENIENKRCSKCGAVKDINEFGINNTNADGHAGMCKRCKADYQKELRLRKHGNGETSGRKKATGSGGNGRSKRSPVSVSVKRDGSDGAARGVIVRPAIDPSTAKIQVFFAKVEVIKSILDVLKERMA